LSKFEKLILLLKLKKSSLLAVLSSFTSNEIREFDDFILSPYFNKNQGVIKLYSYLKKQWPAFDEQKVSKKNVFKKLFPETAYNDGFTRTLMFALLKLAEDFLAYREIKSRGAYFRVNLLKAFNRKNLWKQFEKESLAAIHDMDRVQRRDFVYYYERYSIENETYNLLQKKYFNKTEKFHLNNGIYNITYNLGSYYYITMLRLYLYIINVNELYNIQLSSHELKYAFEKLDPLKFSETPIIPIYYDTIRLHTEKENVKYFLMVKKRFLKNLSILSRDDIMEVIINLENFCKKMMRAGKSEYNGELLELYRLELELQLYKDEPGGLSVTMFISVVKSALSQKETGWAVAFIKEYKNKLNREIRESAVNFAGALAEFTSGRFEKALALLKNIKHTDLYNKFEIKTLLVSSMYELNMFDEMEAAIDSFRHMLSNDKYISPARKKYYINFIRVALKLIKLKTKFDLNILYDVREMIKAPDFITEKAWVEKKLIEADSGNGFL